ncbi:MAG: hypothetical protein AB7Q29_15975 [Vicinamibacterales bacterium]
MKTFLPYIVGAALAWMAITLFMPPRTVTVVDRSAVDSIQKVNDSLTAAFKVDSIRRDSVLVEARARVEEAQIRESRATHRLNETADSLVARLDSTETALFAEFRAEVDSVVAAKDDQITALEVQVSELTMAMGSMQERLNEAFALAYAHADREGELEAALARAEGRAARAEKSAKTWKTVAAVEAVVVIGDAALSRWGPA